MSTQPETDSFPIRSQETNPPPRRGGQPGNTNALRHGLYSERFNARQLRSLLARPVSEEEGAASGSDQRHTRQVSLNTSSHPAPQHPPVPYPGSGPDRRRRRGHRRAPPPPGHPHPYLPRHPGPHTAKQPHPHPLPPQQPGRSQPLQKLWQLVEKLSPHPGRNLLPMLCGRGRLRWRRNGRRHPTRLRRAGVGAEWRTQANPGLAPEQAEFCTLLQSKALVDSGRRRC